MKKLLATLSFVFVCAVPAYASAADYEVDTLQDVRLDGEGCKPSAACSLHDALFLANQDGEADLVEFAGELQGTIKLEVPLPILTTPISVVGQTAPETGAPLIAVDGSEMVTEGEEAVGFDLATEGVTTTSLVEGLAIGGFDVGVRITGSARQLVCGDYIGTDAGGTQSRPNLIGVQVLTGALGATVGYACGQNLISGNRQYGVVDEGEETAVGNSVIGADAAGAALPNGTGPGAGGGIRVRPASETALIGAGGEGGPPNTIAFNEGPGISVASGATGTAIFNNSIFDNSGPGIEHEAPSTATAAPVLTSLEGSLVKGTVAGAPGAEVTIDFFAGRGCDPSGSGEGEESLELEARAVIGAGGTAGFEATLPAHPATRPVVTATAITSPAFETSDFSNCVGVPPLPPAPPPAGGAPKPPASTSAPANGRTLLAEPVSGTILIRPSGESRSHRLAAGELIPVGAIVDARKGRVRLTSVDAAGVEQSADFFGGVFSVRQQAGGTLVVLKLIGAIGPCPEAGASATASKGGGRHLWGSGHGSFRTEGKYGAATVRGTIWLTADRCGGTFFKVRRGVVAIRDFARRKAVTLRAGGTYLASPG